MIKRVSPSSVIAVWFHLNLKLEILYSINLSLVIIFTYYESTKMLIIMIVGLAYSKHLILALDIRPLIARKNLCLFAHQLKQHLQWIPYLFVLVDLRYEFWISAEKNGRIHNLYVHRFEYFKIVYSLIIFRCHF